MTRRRDSTAERKVTSEVAVASRQRVVSLVPSITETLLAWGCPPVGVTRFCDAPGISKVGGTKNPDIEAIVALRADVVLMDREENRSEDADALASHRVKVHATHVRSVADVEPSLRDIAAVLELDQPPYQKIGEDPGPPFLRAWIPIWRRPWMTLNSGTYGSSLLATAGIVNVFADEAETYPQLGLDEARRSGPEVVLAPSEPYPFSERHRAELEQVAPVVFADGQDLFWWGVRTPAALARLRQLAESLAPR